MNPYADLVFEGGTVLTMRPDGATATSVAVRGNVIAAVGDSDEMRAWIGPETRRFDLAGRALIPGVADVHCHLATDAQGGTDRVEVRDFYVPVKSVSDMMERIAAHAGAHPELEEIFAVGSPMQEFRMAEGRRPTQAELDLAVPDRPAYITFGAHILVANTLAVEKGGITALTPDPQGGMIEHDENGRPNGVFRERARYLLIKRQTKSSFEQYMRDVQQRLLEAAARGVTTIHDIVATREEVQVYQALEQAGQLPIRVQLLVRVIESQFDTWSLLDLGIRPGFGSDLLRIGGIKMSIDGGFTARQGLFHPIEDEPEDNHPLVRITQEELDEAVSRYHAAGMRICVHAVGDKSLDMILSSYAAALEAHPRDDHRHRIEHMANFIASDEQVEQARALGVVPLPNPSVLYFLANAAYESLTEQRMKNPMPIRSLTDKGFLFAPGSDAPGYWPVDPIRDAAFCVTRETVDGRLITPEQAITNLEALESITRNAAWLGFMEDKLGTIEVGKLADLAVLASDPLASSAAELATIPVELTVADGQVVYEKP